MAFPPDVTEPNSTSSISASLGYRCRSGKMLELLQGLRRIQGLLSDSGGDVVGIDRERIAEARLTLLDTAGAYQQLAFGGQDTGTARIECVGVPQICLSVAVTAQFHAGHC